VVTADVCTTVDRFVDLGLAEIAPRMAAGGDR
jgi:hypothetical protein